MCLTFFLQFCDIILIPILSIHKIDVKIFILNIICTKHEIFHCFYPLRDLLLFRLRRCVCVCVCVCVYLQVVMSSRSQRYYLILIGIGDTKYVSSLLFPFYIFSFFLVSLYLHA